MNIADYIPTDRFISRKELVTLTGLKDRTIRQKIEKARHNGTWIVSNTNRGGYKITKDFPEWHDFVLREASRALRTFKTQYQAAGQISIQELLEETI